MCVTVTRTSAAAAMVIRVNSMQTEKKCRNCWRLISALQFPVALITQTGNRVPSATAATAMSGTLFGRVPMSVAIVPLLHATLKIQTGSRGSSASAEMVSVVRFVGKVLRHLANVCPPPATSFTPLAQGRAADARMATKAT